MILVKQQNDIELNNYLRLDLTYKYFNKHQNFNILANDSTLREIKDNDYELTIKNQNIDYIFMYLDKADKYVKKITIEELVKHLNNKDIKNIRLRIKKTTYNAKLINMKVVNNQTIYNIKLLPNKKLDIKEISGPITVFIGNN